MSLSSDIERARKNLKDNAEKKLRGTCLSLCGRIIKATPVGNPSLWESSAPSGYIGGTLRNSWAASIGSPSQEAGRAPDASGSDSISSLNTGVLGLQLGQEFYLANNMPYAQRVEDGWSGQAPQGMVKSTLAGAKSETEGKFRG